jgi:hypothetical protein
MKGPYRRNNTVSIRPCMRVRITFVLWLMVTFSTTSSLTPFVPRRVTRTWPTPTTAVATTSHRRHRQQEQHHQQQKSPPPLPSSTSTSSSSRVVLLASSSSNNKNQDQDQNPTKNQRTNTKSSGAGGVYVRPSSAIERGSGFFVPGLEGPKVRLLVGCILLGFTAVNHWLSEWSLNDNGSTSSTITTSTTTTATDVPELVALTYSIYVLFQAVVEFAKEQQQQQQQSSVAGGPTTTTTTTATSSSINSSTSSSNNINNKQLVQRWSSSSSSSSLASTTAVVVNGDDNDDTWEAFQSRVEWAAATFLALTPAAGQLLLLSSGTTTTTTTTTTTSTTTPNQKTNGDYDSGEDKMEEKGGLVILYRLGPPQEQEQEQQGQTNDDTNTNKDGIAAAFRALDQSTSGRIALPLTHPAVTGLSSVLGIPSSSFSSEQGAEVLLSNNASDTAATTTPTTSTPPTIRTVVLQRITPQLCWMMTSDELLARFTNQDWKWLTQLSRRVDIAQTK